MSWWITKPTDEPASASNAGPLLVNALLEPERLASLTPRQWDVVLRLAKRLRLLNRLASTAERHGITENIPATAADVLIAAATALKHRQALITWELDRIRWALQGTHIQPILLKGSAYLMADLPPSWGRSFADVDLLLPRDQLGHVERVLLSKGWIAQKTDTYDQRYYREWMHELPPLRHREREIEVDLHHTILPLTSRIKVPANRLYAAAIPIPSTGYRMLAPADMVLHSATHLFYDGEIKGGLRDLFDLHDLFVLFSQDDGFWENLLPRTAELHLPRPLFYALRYTAGLLQTPIPHAILHESKKFRPNPANLAAMDSLVTRVLTRHAYDRDATPLAIWPLYLRSHWLRMRPLLLMQHLSRKAWRNVREASSGRRPREPKLR